LNAKDHSAANREKQVKWVEDSLKMFKPWMRPLKYIFGNYSRDFVPKKTGTKDFDALKKLQTGLSIKDWMILCKDFKFVPWLMDKTQSLALFHLSNTELGVNDNELGARGGQQVLSMNEFVSCLRGVAMGETFRTLPSMEERVLALASFMRRQAYTMGALQDKKAKANRYTRDAGDLKRRMGSVRQWENENNPKRCPLVEYVYMVPPALNLPPSLKIALEIVDMITARACHVHILTLCPIELTPSEEKIEEAWEPKQLKPVDPAVLERLYGDQIKKQKVRAPLPKKTKGFGGSYVPPPVADKKKKKKKGKRRFGDQLISKMPLKRVKAARMAIDIIAEIADACIPFKRDRDAEGKLIFVFDASKTSPARKDLQKVYKVEGTGFEAVWNAPRLEGISKKARVGLIQNKNKKMKVRPNLHPKETEKAADRKERERLLKLRKDARLAKQRVERQEVLKLLIEEKKAMKQAKIDADRQDQEKNGHKHAARAKSKEDKESQDKAEKAAKIAKWKEDKKAKEKADQLEKKKGQKVYMK
jgi:hypothetical protein